MSRFKELWAQYAPAHGSHVIWMARLQSLGGFLWMVIGIAIDVLHNNTSLLPAIISNQALVAEATLALGVAYEISRRYKAEDLQ